ncbi:hypothetical protein [Spirosoma arcticum]
MTLELHIPDELAATLTRLVPDAESFALEALQTRLKEIESDERLAEEYCFAAKENESVTRDFAAVDAEHWDDY